MKNVRDSIKLFRFNLAYNIIFEITLKMVFFVMFIPLYFLYINLAVNLSGISYLTKETVKRFMKAPSTYAFLFIMLFFIAMCIMIDVAGISYAFHRANNLKKTSPIRMLLVGLKAAFRMLRPRNLPMVPFVLVYFPVITSVLLDYRLLNIRIPYLIDIVSINMYVTIATVVLFVLMVLVSTHYTFLIHVFNVENVSFRKSIDRSKEILKGHRIRVVGGIVLWVILTVGIPAAISYFYTDSILSMILESDSAEKAATMVYEAIKIVFSVMYVLIGIPLVYSFICNSYYNIVPGDESLPNIDDYDQYDAKKSRKKERRILAVILSLAIILDVAFYGLKRMDIISINVEYMDKVTITAHRGDSENAPENTLASFEKAIENGADVIELDVRQTKDGEIVIMHDESLRRTCGVNKKVGEITFDELREYSPVKKYSGPNKEEFAEEKIPTLREAIELVGDRAQMNIELKPARTDQNLEKKVAEIVGEYDYYHNCVVASLNYGAIKRIKRADPKIKTIYVMAVAMGDFYDLEYADGFSIKYRYINNDVIKQAHKRGKKVYAWTVDDKNTLESMMLLNVDSIITNSPLKMRKEMYENYYGDTLIERINEYMASQI